MSRNILEWQRFAEHIPIYPRTFPAGNDARKKFTMSSQMYMDISYTAVPMGSNGEKRHVDAQNLEVLFLNEVVDNPSNTLTCCT
jgi:hypothetical protein